MNWLYSLTHSLFWIPFAGICGLAVLCALLRNISQQKPDLLPAPRCDLIARGGRDAWIVSEPRIITKETT